MVCTRPVRDPEGGIGDEAFCKSQRPLKSLWRGFPGAAADSPLHHRTRGINHHHHHLTKRGVHTQEVSCAANGWSVRYDRTCSRHVLPEPVAPLSERTQIDGELRGPTSRPP